MKHVVFIALAGWLLSSCGKQEPKSEPQAQTVAAPKKEAVSEKKAPTPVPQGKLPVMDPEKAKFIAVPSTPKDPEPKKEEKPVEEIKKADKPAEEAKK